MINFANVESKKQIVMTTDAEIISKQVGELKSELIDRFSEHMSKHEDDEFQLKRPIAEGDKTIKGIKYDEESETPSILFDRTSPSGLLYEDEECMVDGIDIDHAIAALEQLEQSLKD